MSKAKKYQTNLDSDNSTANEFIQLSNQFSEYAKMAGTEISPYFDKNLPYFSALPSLAKKAALNSLSRFNKICEKTLSNGHALKNSKALTWHAMLELKFQFNSDLFSKIEDDDVIELYSKDNIQVFRNFKFIELTSYSVEDVYCRPWTELFKRPEIEKGLKILEVADSFYSKECLKTVSLAYMGTHRIEECDSPFHLKLDAVIKYISPLFERSGNPVGFIAVENAKIVGRSIKSKAPETLLNFSEF